MRYLILLVVLWVGCDVWGQPAHARINQHTGYLGSVADFRSPDSVCILQTRERDDGKAHGARADRPSSEPANMPFQCWAVREKPCSAGAEGDSIFLVYTTILAPAKCRAINEHKSLENRRGFYLEGVPTPPKAKARGKFDGDIAGVFSVTEKERGRQ